METKATTPMPVYAGKTYSVQAGDVLSVVLTVPTSGNVIINPVGGVVPISGDITVSGGDKLVLNVETLDQVNFSGNTITINPPGQLQLGDGTPITVLSGTLYIIK